MHTTKPRDVLGALPEIKGFQEVTLIDWDEKISSILFLGGCNFRCGFCHSSSLVTGVNSLESIPFDNVAGFLKEKQGWIDGVVITGGEPTLHEERLFNLITAIKALGFSVKLDTNGTRPNIVKKLTDEGYVDYIAMDIKAPFVKEAYEKAAGVQVDIDIIKLSKDTIINSGIDYEFRTTVVPGIIGAFEIVEISKQLTGAKKYCLQQFVGRDCIDSTFISTKPYSLKEIERMATLAAEHLPKVIIRRN